MFKESKISTSFTPEASAVVYPGDCLELLKQIPDETVQLVVTSPPYNLGKEYEQKLELEHYLEQQKTVITRIKRGRFYLIDMAGIVLLG